MDEGVFFPIGVYIYFCVKRGVFFQTKLNLFPSTFLKNINLHLSMKKNIHDFLGLMTKIYLIEEIFFQLKIP